MDVDRVCGALINTKSQINLTSLVTYHFLFLNSLK